MKILVVDDEQGIRDLFLFFLEPLGHNVIVVSNGLEAIELIKKNGFDIVFLDVHMPKMSGSETLTKIREIKPQQIVIIFSSGSDPNRTFESKAKELGVFECLYKPFDIDEITNMIKKIEVK